MNSGGHCSATWRVVVAFHLGLAFVQPTIYRARCLIRINKPTDDQWFFQTQFEIIRSTKILQAVSEKLRLQSRWITSGEPLQLDDTVRRLRACLFVWRADNENLIELVFQDKDERRAAEIANTIAEEFEEDRFLDQRVQIVREVEKLRKEWAIQSQRLLRAQQKLRELNQSTNTPDASKSPEAVLACQQEVNLQQRLC